MPGENGAILDAVRVLDVDDEADTRTIMVLLHKLAGANVAGFVDEPRVSAVLEANARGIGLAICLRGVEPNGGSLDMRDVPGLGCVFTVDLPRQFSRSALHGRVGGSE